MVDASLALETIVALSIAAGAVFAIAELREMAKDRRTQLLVGMILWGSSPEVSEMFRKVMYQQFNSRKEAEEKCGYVALDTISTYYTGIGTLIRRGLVDADLAFDFLWMSLVWDHVKPWCLGTDLGVGPIVWEDFEYAAEMDRTYKEKKRLEFVKRQSMQKRNT